MRTTIKKWGINGEGVAYVDRKAIFIQGVLPEEEIEFHITEDKEKYAIGELDRIITKSKDRRYPLCKDWKECGGCSLMAVQYKGQCKMKETVLKESLLKYAGYKGRCKPIIKNPSPLGYRNSCKLPFGLRYGELVTGMYERNTNHFVPLERCYTHSKHIEHVRHEVEEIVKKESLYDKRTKEGFRTLVLKEFDEKVQIIFVTGKNKMKPEIIEKCSQIENVVSIWQNQKIDATNSLFGKRMIHLYGCESMEIQCDDYTLNLLPRSFFQLNTQQAINMYKYVASITPQSKCIVEAYSGIGAMSLFVHEKAEKVIGIESIQDAVDNANDNAKRNNIENVSFICDDAGKCLSKLNRKEKIDTLIVDPPRTGLDSTMKEAILRSNIKTLVYVSCNPSTLSKDLKELSRKYRIKLIQPFDMFSQTNHVETVCSLHRIEKKNM